MHIYSQQIFDKGAKNAQQGEDTLFNNGVGETGYPHTKELNLTLILHQTQQSTQNGVHMCQTATVRSLKENRGKAA